MNIQVQICGLVMEIVLLYFYSRHEDSGLYSEKLFQRNLMVSMLCISLDILSVLGIAYRTELSEFTTYMLCKSYLSFLVLSGYEACFYACSDIARLRNNEVFTFTMRVFTIMGIVAIMVSPILFYNQDGIVYSYGPAVTLTYVLEAILLIGSYLITVIYGKEMNKNRRRAVRLWMLIVFMAGAVQLFYNGLLIVGFAWAVGMIILYAELENPEVGRDRITATFDYQTMRDYIKQLYERRTVFGVLIVCVEDAWRVEVKEENSIILEMTDVMKDLGGTRVFRGVGRDFVVIFEISHLVEEENLDEQIDYAICKLKNRFAHHWGSDNRIDARYLWFPRSRYMEGADAFVTCYHYFRDSIEETEVRKIGKEEADLVKNRRETSREIRKALTDDRVEVYYQPIYSTVEKKFVSAEALVRIRDKDGNFMNPESFIPAAEESGLIEEIGSRVFEKSCEMIRRRQIESIGMHYVEINLSVAQCENPAVVEQYNKVMQRLDVEPRLINLEITESSTIHQRNIINRNMQAFREMGISFSLDDFGSGESNLNYIASMPVEIVKLDKNMVDNYFSSEKGQIVTGAAIQLIKSLRLKIVAEGVERKDQLQELERLGVDYIQGFYFSQPLAEDDFIEFVSRYNRLVTDLSPDKIPEKQAKPEKHTFSREEMGEKWWLADAEVDDDREEEGQGESLTDVIEAASALVDDAVAVGAPVAVDALVAVDDAVAVDASVAVDAPVAVDASVAEAVATETEAIGWDAAGAVDAVATETEAIGWDVAEAVDVVAAETKAADVPAEKMDATDDAATGAEAFDGAERLENEAEVKVADVAEADAASASMDVVVSANAIEADAIEADAGAAAEGTAVGFGTVSVSGYRFEKEIGTGKPVNLRGFAHSENDDVETGSNAGNTSIPTRSVDNRLRTARMQFAGSVKTVRSRRRSIGGRRMAAGRHWTYRNSNE